MLVVVLIGLTVTFVNLNLDPDPDDLVHREGQRIAALIDQLRDESVLSGRPMALEVDEAEQNYFFLSVNNGKWKRIQDDELFRSRPFFYPIQGSLKAENSGSSAADAEETKTTNGRIVVDPLGEISPFVLTLSLSDAEARVLLDRFAELRVERGRDDS